MRNVWIVVASALLAFANFVKSQETSRNLYSSRYDNLDIDTILSSNRLVNNYVDCLLSRKPCPPEGKDLKRILPEALRTKCGRCSATQKENAIKIITTLYNNYPVQYQALRERWDPSGEYHRRLEEYIRGLQFNQIGSNGGNGVSPPDRPVRNDFDRDQSQILLQTLLLSSTTVAPTVPSPNAIPSGPEQRPQLAQTQITQPLPSTVFNPQALQSSQQQQIASNINTLTQALPSQAVAASGSQNFQSIISSDPSMNQNLFLQSGPTTTTAALASRPDTPATTARTTTNPRLILRPVAAGLNFNTDTLPTAGTVSNRFGDDDDNGDGNSVPMSSVRPTAPNPITARPQPQSTTKPVVRQTTSRMVTQRTTTRFIQPAPAVVPLRPIPVQGQVQVQVLAQRPPSPLVPPQAQAQPRPQQPQTQPSVAVVASSSGMTTPNNVIDNFFIPPGQGGGPANPNGSPFVGLFNQLGTKLATTADAIAGMLRKTVDVIVSSHLQAHQRALRSYN
ncbi:mucin-5AC-like isoform X3 [Topomyia yanbarensis]|uniref:mucin-5AC-like isoform X3 n=1 Tax=Topomyia yanbarensis TaxID=2498891 RepID=UPI00273AA86C|nr:mucin-5AC-like isoform X3 [Topomyia yanbarensis]